MQVIHLQGELYAEKTKAKEIIVQLKREVEELLEGDTRACFAHHWVHRAACFPLIVRAAAGVSTVHQNVSAW